MALGRSARYYRKNPKSAQKHSDDNNSFEITVPLFFYEGSDPSATTRYHVDNVIVTGN